MTEKDRKTDEKKPLTLSSKTLTVKKSSEGSHVRQSFTHGRSKTVTVEVKKKRIIIPGQRGGDERTSADGKPLSSAGLMQQQINERLNAIHGAMQTKVIESERSSQETLKEQALLEKENLAEEAPEKTPSLESESQAIESQTPAVAMTPETLEGAAE